MRPDDRRQARRGVAQQTGACAFLTTVTPFDVQSRLGSYYAKLPGGGRSLFADGENWKAATLTDLKVRHMNDYLQRCEYAPCAPRHSCSKRRDVVEFGAAWHCWHMSMLTWPRNAQISNAACIAGAGRRRRPRELGARWHRVEDAVGVCNAMSGTQCWSDAAGG